MNIKSVLLTLDPKMRQTMEIFMVAAKENFNQDGRVMPVIIVGKGNDVYPQAVSMEDKDAVAADIQRYKQLGDWVVFINEAWVLRGGKHEDLAKAAEEGLANHPRRTEALIMSIYTRTRTIAFVCDIEREPTKLGEWALMNDSATSPHRYEGRFA